MLDQSDVVDFDRDGYLIKRHCFDAEEIDLLRQAIVRDEGLRANVTRFADDAGRMSEFVLWNDPGDDLFGAFARCERVVGAMEQLLGGEVYHYHTKLNMKRPHVGGAWNWHQDYGYWYNNGCLFPDMATVAIAVHPATRENGCLQVLRGSHKMGRIDHGRVGGQTGADVDRVNEAMAVLDRVYVELGPGDVVFFHCNTLHGSEPNSSDQPRHQLTCCYNRATNNPFKAHHHPRYTKLETVPDDRIKALGLTLAGHARTFYVAAADATVSAEAAGGRRDLS